MAFNHPLDVSRSKTFLKWASPVTVMISGHMCVCGSTESLIPGRHVWPQKEKEENSNHCSIIYHHAVDESDDFADGKKSILAHLTRCTERANGFTITLCCDWDGKRWPKAKAILTVHRMAWHQMLHQLLEVFPQNEITRWRKKRRAVSREREGSVSFPAANSFPEKLTLTGLYASPFLF